MLTFYNATSNDSFNSFAGSGKAHFIIFNDSASNKIVFSLDGQSVAGIIHENEGIDFHNVSLEKVYIKSYTAGNSCPFRLWFYGLQQGTEAINRINSAKIPKAFYKL